VWDVLTNYSALSEYIPNIAESGSRVQPDGRIVVAGEGSNDFAVARFTTNGALDASFGSGGKVSDKDVTLFTRQLATMMKAGVPLLQAFDIVGRGNSNPNVSRLLADLRADGLKPASVNACLDAVRGLYRWAETRNAYPSTGGQANGSIYPGSSPLGQAGGFWYVRATAKF
jgi:hypothetical protein